MKDKQENPIQVLFSFAGEERGKMTLSVILAVIGELFGMAPFLAAAMLANEVYAGTATVNHALFLVGHCRTGRHPAHIFLHQIISTQPQSGLYHLKKYAPGHC